MKNIRLLICCALLTFGLSDTNAQNVQIITPYAGSGGSLGDGGTATAAQLSNNYMIAVDLSGNLFIADQNANRIRRVDAVTRTITTVAGNGGMGYGAGDGIAATAGSLNGVIGVTVDAAGNIYIGDRNNHRIRKVDGITGIITTICGTGTAGGSADGTMATLAQVNQPRGVALDLAGNVYFTDGSVGGFGGSTHRVRKIDITTGLLSTVAGIGSTGFTGDGAAATLAQLNNPRGLSVDAAGNVFIADMGNQRVRRVDATTGIITTVVGSGSTMGTFAGDGGPATDARLNGLTDVKLDAAGNMYIADVSNSRIRFVDAVTGNISTFTGSSTAGLAGDWGPATSTSVRLSTPISVAILLSNSNYVYISDQGNDRVRLIKPNSIPYFTGGTRQSFSVCEDGPALPINSLLAIYDSDRVQTETWTELVAPLHGTFVFAGTGTANGGVVTPTGKTYTPTPGYSGMDSFIVQISDGMNTSTDTIIVTINPLPVVPAITGFGTVCVSNTLVLSNTAPGGVWSNSNANATVVGGTVTGVTVGTTDIIYTVTNSCGPRAVSRNVTVNPLPNPGTITGANFVCVGSTITLTDPASGTWSASNARATVDAFGVVTGVSVGAVTISYTDVNSCGSASATHAVTVDATPVVPPISGANNVCEAATTILTNSTPGGLWSASNANATVSAGVVTGVTAGAVDISYAVSNGCGASAVSHAVTVNPLPVAGSISGVPNLCAGDNATFTSTAPGGTWSASNSNATVSSGGLVTGVSVGSVVISYSVTNGCGTDVATYAVNIISVPSAGTITGPANVCPAVSIPLTNTVMGGVWTASNSNATVSSGGIVTGVSAGTVDISYTVTVSCGSATAVHTVTVDPLPNPGVITGSSSVCVGATTILTDLAPGGTWSSSTANATVTSLGVVTGVLAGASMISYTVTNVCGTLSATQFMTVNPMITPSVSFIASPGFNTCPATLVTYTALPVNGGTSPVYEWRVNGVALGAGPAFNHIPVNGDVFTLKMTTGAACATIADVYDTITVVVNPTLVPAVNISSGIGDTVCVGTLTTYTAFTVNGGSAPSYTWYVNGIPAAGSNPFSYTPANGDIISCALTSSYACPSPATVMSNNVTMKVDVTQVPEVAITVNPGSPICFGTAVTFTAHTLYGGIPPFISWAKNGITVATGPNYIYTPSNGDNVRAMLASSSVCRTIDSVFSNNINIVTKSPAAMVATIIQSSSFIGVGENDTFVAIVIGAGPTPTFQWYVNGVVVPGAIFSTYVYTGTAPGTQLINCVVGSGDVCNTSKISNILTVKTVGVGISQVSSAGNDLRILPNPSKGIFTLNLGSAIDEPVQVVITNVLGKKVKEFTTTTNTEVEVSLEQPAGIYMISAATTHGKYVAKIVVE